MAPAAMAKQLGLRLALAAAFGVVVGVFFSRLTTDLLLTWWVAYFAALALLIEGLSVWQRHRRLGGNPATGLRLGIAVLTGVGVGFGVAWAVGESQGLAWWVWIAVCAFVMTTFEAVRLRREVPPA